MLMSSNVYPNSGKCIVLDSITLDGVTVDSGFTVYDGSLTAVRIPIVLPVIYKVSNLLVLQISMTNLFDQYPLVDYLQYNDNYAFSPTEYQIINEWIFQSNINIKIGNLAFRDFKAFQLYFGLSDSIITVDPIVITPPIVSTPPMIISLNGSNCEHKDGVLLNVAGRTGAYTVVWSTMGMVADSSFTPIYKVSNIDGHNLILPEALLSLPLVP